MNSNKNKGYLNEDFKIFSLNDKRDIQFEYHHHDFDKIIIFLDGDVNYFIEGRHYKLKPNDVLFISSNEIHKPEINPQVNYSRIAIWVNSEFTHLHYENSSDIHACFDSASKEKQYLISLDEYRMNLVKSLIEKIRIEENSSKLGADLMRDALFISLMVSLNRAYFDKDTSENLKPEDKNEVLIDELIKYIESNLSKDLSIDRLSAEFYISKYYLMRKFKEYTGTSIHNYIVQKRLIISKKFIRKGYMMSEVCTVSGFHDYSSFVRAFKKNYGISPTEYKNENLLFDDGMSEHE
ncbi:MAG: AraC family transcriptional regulator [Clostridioides sp.]|jgi:AraC-like DNA-binding protein/mannose-6-phosphate isomerase-like protein (cupin superfamily)|nr:AraC family transcriptional regulator [Clostridioides sp.]